MVTLLLMNQKKKLKVIPDDDGKMIKISPIRYPSGKIVEVIPDKNIIPEVSPVSNQSDRMAEVSLVEVSPVSNQSDRMAEVSLAEVFQ